MRSFKRMRERPGAEMSWPGATPPYGWLLQDGTVYDIADFPALFAVIGATFGGDGVTTFAVPDMRGRVPVGVDDGAGRVTGGAATLGGTQGAETHTLTQTEMPAHSHSLSQPNAQNSSGGGTYIRGSEYNAPAFTLTVGSAGGSGAHNNMQPSIGKNWIIKY